MLSALLAPILATLFLSSPNALGVEFPLLCASHPWLTPAPV